MINKKLFKKISLLLLIISLCSAEIHKVNAFPVSTGTNQDDGPYTSETASGPPSGPGPLSCDAGAGWTATCSARKSYGDESSLYVDMWDMYGNYITKGTDFEEAIELLGLNNILAGTYVTLDVYEKKMYWKRVNIISNGIQEYHNCQKRIPRTCATYNSKGQATGYYDCSFYIYMYNVKGVSCPGGWDTIATWWEWTSSCDKARQTCKNRNKPSREELYPSFTANYRDSNDIDSDEITTVQPILKSHTTNDHDGNWYWYISDTKIFSYNREKTCIDVKTGNVRYIGKNENCNLNEENEYAIRTAEGRWKYFIPLDANSNDDFSFYTKPLDSGALSGGQCQNLILKYPNEYLSLIQPSKGSFTGNKYNDRRKAGEYGCYWSLNITIPIDQRFYNELENGKNFKGFNFYYKPIDIDNPFPNGLTNTSIWYDWNESDVKNPNLSDSYNGTPTYVAYTSGNEYSIRQYNKLEEYTSWDNMYVNGVSKFIETENIIQRNVDRDSFYALGCGPKNSTNDVNNVFYQQECDIS